MTGLSTVFRIRFSRWLMVSGLAFAANCHAQLAVEEVVLGGVLNPSDTSWHYYLDQMSHDEIARLTGLSRRTIGNRLVEFHTAARLAAVEVKEVAR